jgi:hypothetical protein
LGGELAAKRQITLSANAKDSMNDVTYRQLRLDVCLEGVLRHDNKEGHLGLLARGGAGYGEPYSLLVCPSCSGRAGLGLGVGHF